MADRSPRHGSMRAGAPAASQPECRLRSQGAVRRRCAALAARSDGGQVSSTLPVAAPTSAGRLLEPPASTPRFAAEAVQASCAGAARRLGLRCGVASYPTMQVRSERHCLRSHGDPLGPPTLAARCCATHLRIEFDPVRRRSFGARQPGRCRPHRKVRGAPASAMVEAGAWPCLSPARRSPCSCARLALVTAARCRRGALGATSLRRPACRADQSDGPLGDGIARTRGRLLLRPAPIRLSGDPAARLVLPLPGLPAPHRRAVRLDFVLRARARSLAVDGERRACRAAGDSGTVPDAPVLPDLRLDRVLGERADARRW